MNPKRARRAGIYVRVSTGSQNTENQLRELRQVAERHDWMVAAEFADNGISGSKGRDQRPGLHALLQAVARREIDIVMAWSVDRLGRSLQNLVEFLAELHSKRVDLYLHQQGLDTSTPAGKALFQMMGVSLNLNERSSGSAFAQVLPGQKHREKFWAAGETVTQSD